MNERVALISGASRGIGKAIALELASNVKTVVLGYRQNVEAAEELAAGIRRNGGYATAIQLDVKDPQACTSVAAGVYKEHGRLDILVNNAGIVQDGPALAMSDESWNEVLAVNLTGAFSLSRVCAKYMVLGRWGRIINISSVVARCGGRGQANYVASKSGLEGLTRALAVELAPKDTIFELLGNRGT